MDVYRQKPIPVIFTELPFVRRSDPSCFVDSLEDISTLHELQSVATGKHCVSVLEDRHAFVIKCVLPDDILERNGTTHDLLARHCFFWKMSDIETIFTGSEPAEAVSLKEAGIYTAYLRSIAQKSSCIPLLQKTATLFSNRTCKFIHELKTDILAIEERLFAGLEIDALKGVRPTSVRVKATSTSPRLIPLRLRDQILRRDGYHCIFCGRSGDESTTIEVHHIIPRSIVLRLSLDKGLFDAEENLCTTCFDCNRGKRDCLAKEDIDFYVTTFSNPGHPNLGIVKYLEAVSKIQDMLISG